MRIQIFLSPSSFLFHLQVENCINHFPNSVSYVTYFISLIPPEVLIFNRDDGDCYFFFVVPEFTTFILIFYHPLLSNQMPLLLYSSSHSEMIHWFLSTQIYLIFSATCLTYLNLFIYSSWYFGLKLYTFFTRMRCLLSSCMGVDIYVSCRS